MALLTEKSSITQPGPQPVILDVKFMKFSIRVFTFYIFSLSIEIRSHNILEPYVRSQRSEYQSGQSLSRYLTDNIMRLIANGHNGHHGANGNNRHL